MQLVAEPEQQRSNPAPVSMQLDGHLFPEHVLAMTWDDGPDKHTVELARYLRSQHVSGTFFVVESWRRGLSDYPGSGIGAFNTGYAHLPVLEDLVRLGQRVANHTLNHVVLPAAAPELAVTELTENQRGIDAFLPAEQRLFRAPCGAWSASIARLTSADPYLGRLIGPIGWDIDRKDWESSIECKSSAPARDCEAFSGGLRLKPRVTAARYLDAIGRAGHGIVLLHDRVADVGSKYALEVARALLPPLVAQGYVFAAPVLGFSAPVERVSVPVQAALAERPFTELRLVDADGDGRADLCGQVSAQVVCLRAVEAPSRRAGETPRAFFGAPEPLARQRPLYPGLSRAELAAAADRLALGLSPSAQALVTALADVNGDGRADLCWGGVDGVRCALAQGAAFAEPKLWLAAPGSMPLFGDLNGDGRADVCLRASRAISCAFSTGSSFTSTTKWLGSSGLREDAWLGLGDINGDGRADLCSVADGHVACGLAP